MAKYLKHQFYKHPSIAAVLAHHLADNYVEPDDNVSSKIKEVEKQLKIYTPKIDYLINKDPDGGPSNKLKSKNDQAKRTRPRTKTARDNPLCPYLAGSIQRQRALPHGQRYHFGRSTWPRTPYQSKSYPLSVMHQCDLPKAQHYSWFLCFGGSTRPFHCGLRHHFFDLCPASVVHHHCLYLDRLASGHSLPVLVLC
jgi:hypothetical protein